MVAVELPGEYKYICMSCSITLGFAAVEFWNANVARLPRPAPRPNANAFIWLCNPGMVELLSTVEGEARCTVPLTCTESVGMDRIRMIEMSAIKLIIDNLNLIASSFQ